MDMKGNLESIKKKKSGKLINRLILPKGWKLVFIRVMHDKFKSEITHQFIYIAMNDIHYAKTFDL